MMICRICSHPDRAAIDKAIVGQQQTIRDIATQFGISRSAVDRHKRHIPKALVKAKQAETVAESTTLLSRVEKLAARCESILGKAENSRNWSGAAAASRELRGCLELLAKLNGELQPNGARIAINFVDAIAKMNVAALSAEQLEALYTRVRTETRAEFAGMTGAEIDAAIAEIVLGHNPNLIEVRETILHDDVTVSPPPNIETNRRHDQLMTAMRVAKGGPAWEKKPWRSASPSDRYRMLAAAWKRETGEDLAERIQDLGPRAVLEIEFDLTEERDWMAWPRVRLKHIRRPSAAVPQLIEGELKSLPQMGGRP